jgi:hypothetical protein
MNMTNHIDMDAQSFRTLDVAEFIESIINIACDDMVTLVYDIWDCVENNTCRSWVYEYHTNAGRVKTCIISTEE